MAAAKAAGPATTLSRNTLETLIDLVEIKLGCMEVYDRDDKRELKALEACRDELMTLRTATLVAKQAACRKTTGGAPVSRAARH